MRDDLIGTIVEERYLIEQRLGAGALGCVYRARHTRIGRDVAIKVLRDDLACEAHIVERFEREARIAARLRHPNLVGVLDVGERLMVMELAPGRPLAELIGAPLPRSRVIALVAQLLRGLAHAHGAGLIHRDLKPENILVERHGDGTETARIVDFGIAVLRDRDATSPEGRRLTDAGLVVGTPLYMSPEQATGRAVDHRTDLFSLGVIVYELLSGVPPFDGTGAEVALANVTQDPPLIANRVRGVDVDPLLEAFARKLMARRLDDRFASAHDALAALELIDRDRDAAARALGLFGGPPEPPAATLRLPHDSDALSTLPMAAGTGRTPRVGLDEPDATDATDATDHITRRQRRARWAIAAVAAAACVLVGWALRRADTTGTNAAIASSVGSPHANVAAPVLVPASPVIELPEPPPPPRVPASAALATPRVPASAASPHSVVVTHDGRREKPAAHADARAGAPTAALGTGPAIGTDESAAAVAARYHAVGNALHARGTDELWEQYRRIHLGDAMATPASRHQALATLDAIERALPDTAVLHVKNG
jgi:serine/threonine protein kinase